MQPFCQRWNLDLFDRIVELELVEGTSLFGEALQHLPELQTLTLSPFWLSNGAEEWRRAVAQVESNRTEIFLTGYENDGCFVPYSLVVLGAGRVEPWKTPEGRIRRSLADYSQEREVALTKVVKSALKNTQQDATLESCILNAGSLACCVNSPIP
ncbi:MAG: hypothetical protein Q8M16_02995 [Pirellulaceae bacterium]|nr:hypothetical protein [Pirellulaceae bacterium]